MSTSVLLCDTADEIARFQYHLLREHDLEVEVTTDAFRGVEAAVRSRPDVIVSELVLEGLGGAELVKRFLASSPASRFVAHTIVRDPVRVTEVLAAGASGYVLKEDPVEDSLRAIRAATSGTVTLSGQVAGLLSSELARAVDRARELDAELETLRDDVAKGSTAKADFLANISHELRTPVTVAKGIAYVLKNPAVPDEERAEFLEQLTGSLDKLMGIVDELITLSELERGTFELSLVEIDLAPLVRHALDEVRMRYPGIPIAAEVPDGLHCFADGPRIGSVVRELLDNACRYSPFGRAVELVARDLDEGVTVMVTDRGEGLDRTVASRAFEQPFSTGEGVLHKEKSGVGTGLHLARQLVLEHGGVMWIDPLPGGGTRAAFCIPHTRGERLDARPAQVA
ncbi:MAG TPA: ATP-binding protein [Actinomycetota bacterium]|nr:ATP-binding protein [Actinomycetota bacterium]